LVERLRKDGHRVIEIGDGLKAPDFRHALAVMERAALYIGPEGGLHHGAAAVGTKAVVLFGAWIPPQVTGYDSHINIATGKACGSLKACPHCAEAMASISVDQVFEAARSQL
jgi:ADP-heptose:LPS heptosyltransferase